MKTGEVKKSLKNKPGDPGGALRSPWRGQGALTPETDDFLITIETKMALFSLPDHVTHQIFKPMMRIRYSILYYVILEKFTYIDSHAQSN